MINDQCKIKVIGEIMSIKKLIAYTQIGAEYLRNQQIRQQVHEEKINPSCFMVKNLSLFKITP